MGGGAQASPGLPALRPPPPANRGTDSLRISRPPSSAPTILSLGPSYSGLSMANVSGENIGKQPSLENAAFSGATLPTSLCRSDTITSKALIDTVLQPGLLSATEAHGGGGIFRPSMRSTAAGQVKEPGKQKNRWSLPRLLRKLTKPRHSSNKSTSSVTSSEDVTPKELEVMATTCDAPIETPMSSNVPQHITLMDLIDIQTFEGGFRLSSLAVELRNDLLGHFDFTDFTELEALLSSKSSWTPSAFDEKEPGEIGETLIVISFIRNQFPESEDLWQLIIEKADRWVASFLQDEKDREDVKKWIQEKWH